ncbi:TetR/AcrR family transcriptional regulator [Microbispora corallina]|uniref:TetR/AcrR family transcriptional regulator n=1 Tax=Microbispora corallina TaxID=83302 RepID=UPI001951E8B2|nr:TetR/AcrR family transcriptional regulator [Microbispora corallina]
MNKRAERGQATREHLVAVATRLLAERGYEDTSIEAVLQESGVSRGALYHHFPGKDALFEAALEAVERDIAERTVAATEGIADPVAALRAGCLAWVRLAGEPVVRRIVLVDAPAVLGWHRWREIEERHAFGLLKAALQAAADAGGLQPGHVDVFAHVLLASVNEIALLVARGAGGDGVSAEEAEAAVGELLRRLLPG